MPLSWNEIRVRATSFSNEWKDAHCEKSESQSFYNAFFKVFGRRRRDVAVYEEKVKKLNDKTGFIDLFWPGHLLIEQKSAGRSLKNAREQATDYFLSLKEEEKPRYILLSDFQTFELLDLEDNKEHHFKLSELPEKVKLFDFVAGYQQQKYQDQDPVNIEASELMSNLHEQLEESGYVGGNLERLLVRVMFCLFADDTGIFDPDIFLRFIEDHTKEDGSDLGSRLIHLFEILDTEPEQRSKTLDEDLAVFPYVNGELFSGSTCIPSFNKEMRDTLLKCCYFNWSKVSPALFGSLFQTVMLPEEQRQGGTHYTSERNILKIIKPLFLDDLQTEFKKIKSDKSAQRGKRLERFHKKLASLTFFDPACGCGNFLILSYRELRLLEIEILEELYPIEKSSKVLDIDHLSKIDVDQFFGIEIEEFPARIAESAMWLVDHQMNMKLSDAFGQVFLRLPLQKSPHILNANALSNDWPTFLSPKKCNYILGNPPFIGHHLQTEKQKSEMKAVLIDIKASGVMDYVSAWFMKATKYIQNTTIKVAFVSTNSITQGEQVGILWSVLCQKYNVKIQFAHRTFKWTIDEKKAKGMNVAAVYVVIIGFSAHDQADKKLYEYETVVSNPHCIKVKNINPYLVDAPDIFITNKSDPICNVPPMRYGNKPTDGGYFLMTDEEKKGFLLEEPRAKKFIKPFMSSKEFLRNEKRWVLWLVGAKPHELKALPKVMERIEAVKAFRGKSKAKSTKEYPYHTLFRQVTQPSQDYILVPRTTSENRMYLPLGLYPADHIVSDTCQSIPAAKLYHFGVLTSKMHMDWMHYTSGRLKSDYRYSKDIVYNNFPWPNPNDNQRKDVEEKAKTILNVRSQFFDSPLTDLYSPSTMPPELLKAHHALDKAVDKIYRKSGFKDDKERIEFLFELYQKITEPLIPPDKKKGKKTHAR